MSKEPLNIDENIISLTGTLNELRLVYDIQKTTIEAQQKLDEKFDPVIFDDIVVRLSLHTLITISALDLLANLKLYYSAKHLWEKTCLIKSSYLIIHETIIAFERRKIKLRNLFLERKLNIKPLDEVGINIKEFKRAFNYAQINKIRNKAVGHIDDDFVNYFDIVMSIDTEEGVKAILKLLEILGKLNILLLKLRKDINEQKEQELAELKRKVEEIESKILEKMKEMEK